MSDLHFGKTGHFRKSGIAIPQSVYREDMQRLLDLIHFFKPAQLLVVGDFFHSNANVELEWFLKWRNDIADLPITLIKGNHDILKKDWYLGADIDVVQTELSLGPFRFSHDRCDAVEGQYLFCGHLHPGIQVNGLGKQSLRLPCFYFGREHCTLPAFSKFSGMFSIHPAEDEVVYAIVENKLVRF